MKRIPITASTSLLSILLVLIGSVAFLASLIGVFLSMFLFDDPLASSNPLTWLLAFTFWMAPIMTARSVTYAADAYATNHTANLKPSVISLVAPILSLAVAYLLLTILCDGHFGCRT